MSSKLRAIFGDRKPVIAMVHLGALPGSPLHDGAGGLAALVEGARKDLHALQAAGFDAVMFGNENDGLTNSMSMSPPPHHGLCDRPAGRRDHGSLRRQRALGSDQHDCAGGGHRGSFVREIFTGTMPPTWGPGRRMPARRCVTATGWGRRMSPCSTMSRRNSPFRSTSGRWPTGRVRRSSPRFPDAVLVLGPDHRGSSLDG